MPGGRRRCKREQRPRADQQRSPGKCDEHRRHHGHEASRLPLEQQQFDRQHDRSERRPENAGHARACAGDQQCLALGGGQPEQLREQGSDGAAGHDDRSLGTEWAAAADRHRRRKRLQQRDLRATACCSPNRMVSIASGMPWPRILSDPNRAIRPTTSPPMIGMRTIMSALRPLMAAWSKRAWRVPHEVCRQRDQLQQRPGAERAARSGNCRHRGKEEHPGIGAIIGETPAGSCWKGCHVAP